MVKKISISVINDLANTNPHAWHRMLSLGTLDPTRMFLYISDDNEAKALNELNRLPDKFRRLINAHAISTTPLPEAQATRFRIPSEVERVKAICEKCEWNINNICEHSGCKPCKQRSVGGLSEKIRDTAFVCAAGKWV